MIQTITEKGFQPDKVEFFGSKFLMGNGYLGYRGTLEEDTREQLAACTLSELYDQNADKWREPVNAPNPLFIRTSFQGRRLSVREFSPKSHTQSLLLDKGAHERRTEFELHGGEVEIKCLRFASMAQRHLLAARYSVCAGQSGTVSIAVAIDKDIWDLNGPHLHGETLCHRENGVLLYRAKTGELGVDLAVAQRICCKGAQVEETPEGFLVQKELSAGESLTVTIICGIYKSTDPDTEDCFESAAELAGSADFDKAFEAHCKAWEELWEQTLVKIEGDEEAELALRHSTYLLLCSTPFHTSRVAIPGRGLSGQVYKGAMFWDTELYMLPLFLTTLPNAARNLVKYRINTLEGARRKAKEYGYRGAFYAWESQETGDDGCTEYNINDIFTGRPIRTYFRDKQVHISADVAYGIWKYYKVTGDIGLLLEGGMEVMLECMRFLYSYSYFKSDKRRYELLDVTGADEYHERVNNDAYTNALTRKMLGETLCVLSMLERDYPREYQELLSRLDFYGDIPALEDFLKRLYDPTDKAQGGVIEQFDGYFKLEDVTPKELYQRILKENEYLGSPVGLAVNTQMIKQADVVLLTALFPEKYPVSQIRENFAYYEPRTEHGSSLSTCIYALAAARCGMLTYAYRYFMQAAAIDLNGGYKLYVGDLYIGGTHPAAGGGSYMVAVYGFGGLSMDGDAISLSPKLPQKWRAMLFTACHLGQRYSIRLTREKAEVKAAGKNQKPGKFIIDGRAYTLQPGEMREICL